MNMDNSTFESGGIGHPAGCKDNRWQFPSPYPAGSDRIRILPLAQGGKIYYSEYPVQEDTVIEPWIPSERGGKFLCAQALLSGSVRVRTTCSDIQQDVEQVLLFSASRSGFHLQLQSDQVVRCVGVALPLQSEELQGGAIRALINPLCGRETDSRIASITLQRHTRRWALELCNHISGANLPAADLQREGLVRCYLSSLLNDYAAMQQSPSAPVNPLTSREARTSEQICGYLESNLDRALSMQLLEARFGLSRYRLNELFKLSHGLTFSGYIRQQRLLKARQLIEREGVPVKAAALNVGYRYVSNFTRAYREYFGCTPGNSSPGAIEER